MNHESFSKQVLSTAKEGNLGAMRALVKDTIDCTDSNGRTAAYLAAQSGNVEMLKYLQNFGGADVLKSANDGSTPLSISIQKGHIKVVKYFCEERGMQALINPTLLFIAARHGSTEVVQYLMKEGRLAEIETVQSMKDDAIEMAARNGHVATVKCLSELGARKDISLMIAAQEGRVKVLRFLLDQGMDMETCHCKEKNATLLVLAAMNGHLAAARFLVEKGVDKMKANDEGWNALHFSSAKGHLDVMKYLVENGADIKSTTKKGETVLYIAAQYGCNHWYGRVAVVDYLVQQGADKESHAQLITPIRIAAKFGNLEVVQYLVAAGARLDCYYPPLYLAAQAGNLKIVQYFCGQGEGVVNICGKGRDKRTPLYAAAENGHLDIVHHLTEAGADVNNAASYTGNMTPLHIAAQKGHAEIVTCLTNWGADLSARTSNTQQLPFDLAANDAIRQLIHDEEDRRRNHGFKRAVIPPSSPIQEEDDGGEPDSKRPRLDGEGSVEANTSRDEGSSDDMPPSTCAVG